VHAAFHARVPGRLKKVLRRPNAIQKSVTSKQRDTQLQYSDHLLNTWMPEKGVIGEFWLCANSEPERTLDKLPPPALTLKVHISFSAK
jgi:hypothetical protein